jgi:two-component system osmolarity sensor histidine kinase EnvZ
VTIEADPVTVNESAAAESSPPRRGVRAVTGAIGRFLHDLMPKGLYARALIIIIAPIVILQAIVAFVFMERHSEQVTNRLSASVVRQVAALVDLVEAAPPGTDFALLQDIAAKRLELNVSLLPLDAMPAAGPKPFFTDLDRTLSRQIDRTIGKPYWVDTVGNSNLVEIRIQLRDRVLRVFAPRSAAYATNSLVFIFWMFGTSLVLLAIAILFLRNQIRPILRLASAAEDFGKGRPTPDFRLRGAREVRAAAQAFMEMRSRIERQIEQRTAMLAGVSHDLRTVLTRFRLQLELLKSADDAEALKNDIADMQKMLEGYLAFARGDTGERAETIDVTQLIGEVIREAAAAGIAATSGFSGDPTVRLRPQSFKRCLTNLVVNAGRHGKRVEVVGNRADGWLRISVDDDGPGIPPEEYEAVFRPFYRLDEGRNLDRTGTGLGLSIARDIARVHGGEIVLDRSPLGGLRATIAVPA